MKQVGVSLLAGASAISLRSAGENSRVTETLSSPVIRVVKLLTDLKAGVEKDGRAEQQSYDKYACWCEDALSRKAQDIGAAKQEIDTLQTEIEHLEGVLGSGSAEIAQLKKDISQNIDAAKEAEAVRRKDWQDFDATKNENEQCAGALEAAIKVLSGAGTGKAFLESLQEAQLLSVVDGVRNVLSKSEVVSTMSTKDLDMVKKFISQPQAFASQAGFMSAAQTAANPFGDYAPKSTQIRGILKGMYDSFVADLEKDNADEANKQKAYRDLKATKDDELDRLQKSLGKSEVNQATNSKDLATNRETRSDTQDRLQADEVFFQDTKNGCKQKAGQWAERSRLRTEELTGIAKAVEILSSNDAKATFNASASATFLQVLSQAQRGKQYSTLQHLASKMESQGLTKFAMQLRSGGRFDEVMISIDKMIALLRAEESDDIAHRDRCQSSQNKNQNDLADFNHVKSSAEGKRDSLQGKITQQEGDISTLNGEITTSKSNLATLLSTRNAAEALFKKNLKDDADAVDLIDQALATLAAFYKRNDKKISFVQTNNPTYAVDKDAAPSTLWDKEGKNYGGRSSETGGILAILEMIREDVLLEMKVARKDDVDAQTSYETERSALQTVMDKQLASKAHAEKVKADAASKKAEESATVSRTTDELIEERKLKGNLETNCAWVKTHFETRRTKRIRDMQGLTEAKEFLASGNSLD